MSAIVSSISPVLRELARQQPVDVDAFDTEFFGISPITEIWSKGRVGV
jgi:hypothetical protein